MQTALLLALGCGAALLSVAAADEYDHKVRGCRGGGEGRPISASARGAPGARVPKKKSGSPRRLGTPLL